MTNDDFRKLMMTPRAGSGSSSLASGVLGSGSMTPLPNATPSPKTESKISPNTEKGEKRKKKKSYYAKLKRYVNSEKMHKIMIVTFPNFL